MGWLDDVAAIGIVLSQVNKRLKSCLDKTVDVSK